jgi:hypothetical protein
VKEKDTKKERRGREGAKKKRGKRRRYNLWFVFYFLSRIFQLVILKI